jgi:hypothetical protein
VFLSSKVTNRLQGMSFWGPKGVTEFLWISELSAFSIYCLMDGEVLGLLFHDITLTVLYNVYKRNYINLISFGTQTKVTVLGTVQLSLAAWLCPSDSSVCLRDKPQFHAR